jgi:hypothetical protein
MLSPRTGIAGSPLTDALGDGLACWLDISAVP